MFLSRPPHRSGIQPSRQAILYRIVCIFALAAMLCLLDEWLPAFISRIAPSEPSTTTFTQQATRRAVPTVVTAVPTAVPTSTPTPPARHLTPTPAPNPSPIEPFPSYLPQQVALLEARDRFLYHGNTALPEIALTFDDGPNPPYTTQILSILQRYNVKATFFCVGQQVQAYPWAVQQEHAAGHLIGNHTWGHPFMPQLSEPSVIWQLSTTQDIIEHTTGVRPTFFRPPYGAFNALTLKYVNYFALTTFLWNVDPSDWSMPGVNAIVQRVLYQAGNGSIILLHDGGGNRWQTVAALPLIITWFQQHGFRFVTLQQLIDDLHSNKASTRSIPT
jgi:peptidoglycan-N-acetylglucosamine deacetylase